MFRVSTPDFIINGVKTELKTLNGTSLNTPVTRITDAFKQGADAVIIDARNVGITAEQANQILIELQALIKIKYYQVKLRFGLLTVLLGVIIYENAM